MPWNTPNTSWSPGDVVGASDMNEIGEDLAYLKAMPYDLYLVNEGADYTTSSTSFVDVDTTDLTLSLTTTGGDVLCYFHGSFNFGAAQFVYLDVSVDGVRYSLDDGALIHAVVSAGTACGFTLLITGLSAGAHTFALQWKTNTNTLTMYAGAGTSGKDTHPLFWVREV